MIVDINNYISVVYCQLFIRYYTQRKYEKCTVICVCLSSNRDTPPWLPSTCIVQTCPHHSFIVNHIIKRYMSYVDCVLELMFASPTSDFLSGPSLWITLPSSGTRLGTPFSSMGYATRNSSEISSFVDASYLQYSCKWVKFYTA